MLMQLLFSRLSTRLSSGILISDLREGVEVLSRIELLALNSFGLGSFSSPLSEYLGLEVCEFSVVRVVSSQFLRVRGYLTGGEDL
jgi:hypothetical protein